jgi:ABC-2 type transport system ATP-binding protein
MNVIQAKKLTKFYGKNRGIIDLDLKVNEGEIYGFIGPNGAGKSTTIKLLLDFIRPTSGSCSVFGLDCIASSAKIKRDTGYIPAEVSYYDGMRVSDLLRYSAKYYGGGFAEHTKKLCETLELDTTRKISELSSGNKKKVAIAQAMLHRPKLLIMDEPTSGLDPLMQHVFYGLVREAKDEGATVFFSSHILTEVQRVCDRVGIIREGRLISTQSIEELAKTQYKRVKATVEGEIKIPGAEGVKRRNGSVEFLYKGAADKLIKALARYSIRNIVIEDPPLEDIFMAYYKEGGK